MGIPGYFIAKHPFYDRVKHIQNWKNYKLLARGKHSYLDDVIAEAKKKNYPVYSKQLDWSKMAVDVASNGHSHKFEFRKSKKETLNEEIIRKEKAKKSPAPGAYEMPKFKV